MTALPNDPTFGKTESIFFDTKGNGLDGTITVVPPSGVVTEVVGIIPTGFNATSRYIRIGTNSAGLPERKVVNGLITCPANTGLWVITNIAHFTTDISGFLCNP